MESCGKTSYLSIICGLKKTYFLIIFIVVSTDHGDSGADMSLSVKEKKRERKNQTRSLLLVQFLWSVLSIFTFEIQYLYIHIYKYSESSIRAHLSSNVRVCDVCC